MTVTTAKWTLEDFHQMVDAGLLEGRAVEFLNGEIVEMSPEGAPHAAASSDAGDYLSGLLGGRRAALYLQNSRQSERRP